MNVFEIGIRNNGVVPPPGAYSKLSAWLRIHAIAASLIVFSCSSSIRVFFAWQAEPSQMVELYPDADTYLAPVRSLVERGAFLDREGYPIVSRTPGYPTFLAIIMSLVGQNLRTVLIAQAIVLSSGVLILYWFSRKTLPPVTAITGCLLAAFSPWGAVLAGLPLSDGTFVFFLALIFFAMKLTDEAPNLPAVLLGGISVGLLTGASVLVRPLWPLVMLVPGALFLGYGPKRKGAWILLSVTLICAVTPVALWRERNQREAHFNSLSDTSGKTVWRYLASRVKGEVNGQDRFAIKDAAMQDDRNWGLSVQEADNERWRRAKAVFRDYPFLTVYSFARSATEHMIHPSPDVLVPARLSFHGDFFLLALLWGGILILAFFGLLSLLRPNPATDDGEIDRRWLLTSLVICVLLTLSSGISFGAGSRLRAPLELTVPLLAAVGLTRAIRAFQRSVERIGSEK